MLVKVSIGSARNDGETSCRMLTNVDSQPGSVDLTKSYGTLMAE
jgi:hypothetical protein